MSTIVTKPWGREIIVTTPDLPYAGKILELKAGQKLSLQYHDQKIETLTLISGEAKIILDNEEKTMIPFEGFLIRAMVKHRIIAITDCQIMEVSTGEIGTTFRLEDDYSRPNETEEIRSLPNRGWSNS